MLSKQAHYDKHETVRGQLTGSSLHGYRQVIIQHSRSPYKCVFHNNKIKKLFQVEFVCLFLCIIVSRRELHQVRDPQCPNQTFIPPGTNKLLFILVECVVDNTHLQIPSLVATNLMFQFITLHKSAHTIPCLFIIRFSQ